MFSEPRRTPSQKSKRQARVGFIDPDPREVFIGNMRLDRFLASMDLGWVLRVRDVLRELDWQKFEARYPLTGRSPYRPVAMMSLRK